MDVLFDSVVEGFVRGQDAEFIQTNDGKERMLRGRIKIFFVVHGVNWVELCCAGRSYRRVVSDLKHC